MVEKDTKRRTIPTARYCQSMFLVTSIKFGLLADLRHPVCVKLAINDKILPTTYSYLNAITNAMN